MRSLFLSFLIGFAWLEASAQSINLWQAMKNRFPEEPAVFVERAEVLNIFVEKDSLKVYTDVSQDLLHLKEQTDVYSGQKVYGSHFSQVAGLKARTLVWEKNRYNEIDVSSFKKNSDRDRDVFYDDSYYYSFNFPSVASQNRTQLQYRQVLKDARFIPGYVFASYLPQARTAFTIKTTRDVELYFEVVNDPDKTIKFKKSEKGKAVTYEWIGENVPAFRSEEQAPSIRYYAPHVICYVKSYQTKDRKVEVLSGIDGLYQWYRTFIHDLNKETSAELRSIVETIRKSSKTDQALARNIFYWVQDNIQYIAFEQGMRGLIPHHGSYTCEKRYGDCKDMANLIVNMFELAGLKAYHTWIGTRDLPYKYSALPTPLVDNHMIATYISPEGQYYFLDATSDYTPFDYPSSMIQGKEAFIAISANTYELRTVPVIENDHNLMADSITLRVDDNDLIGSGKCLLQGYPKVFGGYNLDRAEQQDVEKYVAKLVGKGNNKFFLDNFSVSDLNNRDKPTQILYDFRISDYFQKIGEELYINLNLNKDFYNNFINTENRKSPKESEYKYVKHEYLELIVPPEYVLDYLPANVSYKGELLGYEITYKAVDDKIIFSKKLYLDYLLMQPAQFDQWNNEVRKISEAYKESIIFKKK